MRDLARQNVIPSEELRLPGRLSRPFLVAEHDAVRGQITERFRLMLDAARAIDASRIAALAGCGGRKRKRELLGAVAL